LTARVSTFNVTEPDTVFEKNNDFRRKSQFFPSHEFNAPLKGIPLEICNSGNDQKTRMVPLPDGEKCALV